MIKDFAKVEMDLRKRKPNEIILESTLNLDQSMTYKFRTPDLPTEVHLMIIPTSHSAAIMEFTEGDISLSRMVTLTDEPKIYRITPGDEWILKPNIWYAIKLTSQSDNNDCKVFIFLTDVGEKKED